MRLAVLKAAIVLIPTYFVAWLTGEMVWVVPTLAATAFFAQGIGSKSEDVTQRVDEDGDDD